MQPEDWEAMASAIAHEMGNPLAVAQSAIRVLHRSLDADEESELAEAALRSLQLMDLQLARLRALDAEPLPSLVDGVDLVEVVEEVVRDLDRTLLGDHPTTVNSQAVPKVRVDPDQIRQVLFNLLSNAAKYSPKGRRVAVTVSADEDTATVRVHDQGAGVAPEDAQRIFERYERGEEGRGLGLGLFLSRRIVRAHGGDLRFVGVEGGSVFEFTLPNDAARPDA